MSTTEPIGTETAPDAPTEEWAVVELFGHRRHVGRISEEQRFGAAMLRIDVPTVLVGEDGVREPATWLTHWYGGASIFSVTPTDEASVMRAAERRKPAPFVSLELRPDFASTADDHDGNPNDDCEEGRF